MKKTTHGLYFKNSNEMSEVESETVDLMITSPPYPMIEMWDNLFSSNNEEISLALQEDDGKKAYNLMHDELDKIWTEVARVLKPSGIACVNIGDATRKINKSFQLFTNHVKISAFFEDNGFISLPCILWRKPTNSPNKFLGSGMLPPNAYVTLEHEYILIFKKGKRNRKIPPKSENRYNSAFFWEERNRWFSDVWEDIRGVSQKINNNNNNNSNKTRERSAAYPLMLPYRLINMFSIHEDVILDPFWGTGTTTLAAIISARNSIGYELNSEFKKIFDYNLQKIKKMTDLIKTDRIQKHYEFIQNRKKQGKEIKYNASNYDFQVITKQEEDILFYSVENYEKNKHGYVVRHKKFEFEQKRKLIQSRLVP